MAVPSRWSSRNASTPVCPADALIECACSGDWIVRANPAAAANRRAWQAFRTGEESPPAQPLCTERPAMRGEPGGVSPRFLECPLPL